MTDVNIKTISNISASSSYKKTIIITNAMIATVNLILVIKVGKTF